MGDFDGRFATVTRSRGREREVRNFENQETRKAFLTAAERRIRFIYVPKHSSWLNQVEIWFSVVVRRVLKRSHFESVDQLKQRLLDFIDYFNETMAKPYRWTFTGQPLKT